MSDISDDELDEALLFLLSTSSTSGTSRTSSTRSREEISEETRKKMLEARSELEQLFDNYIREAKSFEKSKLDLEFIKSWLKSKKINSRKITKSFTSAQKDMFANRGEYAPRNYRRMADITKEYRDIKNNLEDGRTWDGRLPTPDDPPPPAPEVAEDPRMPQPIFNGIPMAQELTIDNLKREVDGFKDFVYREIKLMEINYNQPDANRTRSQQVLANNLLLLQDAYRVVEEKYKRLSSQLETYYASAEANKKSATVLYNDVKEMWKQYDAVYTQSIGNMRLRARAFNRRGGESKGGQLVDIKLRF